MKHFNENEETKHQEGIKLIPPYNWLDRKNPHRVKPCVIPKVFQDGPDDLLVFNEGEDPHDSPTLWAGQGISLVNLLN